MDVCNDNCKCALCMTDEERDRCYLTIVEEDHTFTVVMWQVQFVGNDPPTINLLEKSRSYPHKYEADVEAALWAAAEAVKWIK